MFESPNIVPARLLKYLDFPVIPHKKLVPAVLQNPNLFGRISFPFRFLIQCRVLVIVSSLQNTIFCAFGDYSVASYTRCRFWSIHRFLQVLSLGKTCAGGTLILSLKPAAPQKKTHFLASFAYRQNSWRAEHSFTFQTRSRRPPFPLNSAP